MENLFVECCDHYVVDKKQLKQFLETHAIVPRIPTENIKKKMLAKISVTHEEIDKIRQIDDPHVRKKIILQRSLDSMGNKYRHAIMEGEVEVING